MKIGVIIPALNAERTLGKLILKIRELIPEGEIIVVDDGSVDGTAKVAEKVGAILISHGENKGKGAALQSGFQKALELGEEAVVTIDADGQHDPASIPDFINLMEESNCDIIIGSRMSDIQKMPIPRILSNKITSSLISWRVRQRIADTQSGYRIIKADVLKNVALSASRYEIESELLINAGLKGYKIGALKIDTIYGDERSTIHPISDTFRFVFLFLRSLFW